jgi:hypothetical protein
MSGRRILLALTMSVLLPLAAAAEDLRDLLTNLLAQGITLAPATQFSHATHFISVLGQFDAFSQFNQSLSSQLSSFPLPSSSGGFTYTFDPKLGTFTRGSDSFGPVYAERVDTVGKGRFNLGLNYSHFSFDRINDLDLNNGDLKLVFHHQDTDNNGNDIHFFFEGDAIQAQLRMKVDSDITALVATYGVSNRFDIGFALPLVHVSITPDTDLEINRLATGHDPVFSTVHQFRTGSLADPNCASVTVDQETGCRQVGSASGIGDVLLRAKFRLTESSNAGVALATDVRLPTGREQDLLGTGVTQIKAYLIASAHLGPFSPHINAGYTWAIHRCNGLSDQAPTSTDPQVLLVSPRELCRENHEGLSDEINYTGGFDLSLGPHVTFAADVIGRTFRNTHIIGVVDTPFTSNTANNVFNPNVPPVLVTTTLPQLSAPLGDLNTLLGSVGFKINPFGNLLVTVNGLFPITKKGLQDKFTPVVGLDYAF